MMEGHGKEIVASSQVMKLSHTKGCGEELA